MSEPHVDTFRFLADSDSPAATELLIAGLDAEEDAICAAGVQALSTRSTPRGQFEIVRRFDRFGPAAQQLVASLAPRLAHGTTHALQHGDPAAKVAALHLVRRCEAYDLFPHVVDLLQIAGDDIVGEVEEAFRDLVDRAYDHNRPSWEPKSSTANPVRHAAQIRQAMLQALDAACAKFESLARPRPVVEAVLTLGESEGAAVKRVLRQASPECRTLAAEIAMQSRHPGVMRLVVEGMSANYPHPVVFDAFAHRTDPEFVSYVLRWMPGRPGTVESKNLRQIESVDWIDAADLRLDVIPPGLQASLVSFVAASGLPTDVRRTVEQWLVRHGSAEARHAATNILLALDPEDATGIVQDGLPSADAGIQAWATSQLKTLRVPDANAQLVRRLDSEMDLVRDAAREGLKSFNLESMLDIFETLEPRACRRGADLLRKIDPEAVEKLRKELQNPIRRRRVRAAQAAAALGWLEEILPNILGMAVDQDTHLRRIAAQVLGDLDHPDGLRALQALSTDASPRVRDDALASIARLGRSRSASETPWRPTRDLLVEDDASAEAVSGEAVVRTASV